MSPDEIRRRWPRALTQRDWDHMLVRWAVFIGAASAVVAQADAIPAIWRVLAGALSAGCVALCGLLRPPGVPKPRQQEDGKG